jgi:NAD(P)-dependent dehydrogenase (short-subunit alcohol dehydrogenase family)
MRPVCLITGAAGRLGSALCESLAKSFDVVATYHTKPPTFRSQLRHKIASVGEPLGPGRTREVFCVQANLLERTDIRRLVEVALAKYGRVDVIINSAADTRFYGNLLDLCHDDPYPASQMQLNCVVPVELVSAIFHESWKDESTSNAKMNRCVINVSSVSGLYALGTHGQGFYSASKAALNMLTMHMALELAPYSVRVNSICPGRFTDQQSTSKVVASIKTLIEGDDTGIVAE